ncbi:protein phosphatase 1 regulatory subunit 21 [Nephila pilipes]|uniref:Protein phosphatase 1 regulatory subunit 21 n=1 Tax=Nephila pilipes TaxID=299642 RepID=A0A8X6JGQ9_NEPPI|nr:protein phosphatase 1 regulatory subunit 21 [Nephila pilipes]
MNYNRIYRFRCLNNCTSMEENSEVILKYQKLALEYSKLKAQTSVLKTAISEEQGVVQEIQETLKKKDQLIRKLEQEVECLNFRNVQLAKRVSVLQSDLEVVDSSTKHSKSKHSSNVPTPSSESYNVLNVELQSRIEENEKLHQQIYAADLEQQKIISELTSTIDSLQSKLADLEKKFSEKIAEQEGMINTLQKEKIKMQVSLKNHEQEMKDRKKTEETKVEDVTVVKEDLALQIEEAKKVIAEKVLFNDRREDSLNIINVPIIQRGKHEHLSSLMLKMQGFISDFSRQLSDLHNFMIQRLCSKPTDSNMKTVVVKLELYLRENIQNLKAIPLSFECITSAIKSETLTWDKSSIMDFCNAFQKYEKNLDKLLPFLILRIQDKDSWVSTSPKLIELVGKLVSLSRKLMACFNKLYRYMLLLAVVGSADKNKYYISQATIMQKILLNIDLLQQLFEEARKLFGSKIALDHQLPMLTQSEKSTDECILTTLVSLSLTLKKMTDLMEKDIDVLSSNVWYKPRNSSGFKNATLNPCVWQYKERGSKYVLHISQNDPPSIPYEVALKNWQTLCEHSDNKENLTQQLEQYQNKVMQLELDKENWMLECQLLRAKGSQDPDASHTNVENKAQDYDEIHLYVKNTVNQLIKQIQFADSKAIAFKNECETLHQKLTLSVQKKEELQNEILSSRQVIDRMKDEQKTLIQTYNEQLNTMSEHLANLNETLTTQKDEIDALKQAGNKGSRKGKSK